MDEQVADCLEQLLSEYVASGQRLLMVEPEKGVPQQLYPSKPIALVS